MEVSQLGVCHLGVRADEMDDGALSVANPWARAGYYAFLIRPVVVTWESRARRRQLGPPVRPPGASRHRAPIVRGYALRLAPKINPLGPVCTRNGHHAVARDSLEDAPWPDEVDCRALVGSTGSHCCREPRGQMEKQTRRFSWSVAVPCAWALGPWWYLKCALDTADRVTFWQPERAKVRD
jgi:hypothetical protein